MQRAKAGAGASPGGNDLKIAKKERILRVLTRLNDRDTQRPAAEDLLAIISDMDGESLTILISAVCSAGGEQKVYARKECARALGVVASAICPSRATALQQPALGRILTHLKKLVGDSDSSVREAAAEALGLVARGLSESGGSLASLIKLLQDCLAEGKKEAQAGACAALALCAPSLGGSLEPAFIKELIKKVNTPSFHAPHSLIAALAFWDPHSNSPEGLMKTSAGSFAPLLPSLIGQPAIAATSSPGSGVLGALSSKEW